jgi:hypothetical protein
VLVNDSAQYVCVSQERFDIVEIVKERVVENFEDVSGAKGLTSDVRHFVMLDSLDFL